MAQVLSFRDFDAWQVAMALVANTYGLVRRLPANEPFGLSAQMRRAAVSIPSNVAEEVKAIRSIRVAAQRAWSSVETAPAANIVNEQVTAARGG